jgi:ankyrin repeat protein
LKNTICALLVLAFAFQTFAKKEKYDGEAYVKAAASGDVKTVKKQLDLGVPINFYPDADDIPATALELAIVNDRFEVYELILKRAGPKHDFGEYFTPITHAIQPGRERFLDDLLKRKLGVNERSLGSALAWAAARHDTKLMEKLIDNGAQVDYVDINSGETALFPSVRNGCLPCVEKLLKKGADKAHKDRFNRTAGEYVGEAAKRAEILKLLK